MLEKLGKIEVVQRRVRKVVTIGILKRKTSALSRPVWLCVGPGNCKIGPIIFLAGWHKKCINQASVLSRLVLFT